MANVDLKYLYKSHKISYALYNKMWNDMCGRHDAMMRIDDSHTDFCCDCINVVLELNGLLAEANLGRMKRHERLLNKAANRSPVEFTVDELFPFNGR